MVAVPSAELTSTVKPPSTALSKVTLTVMFPASSSPLTSAIVTVAESSLVIVPIPVASNMFEIPVAPERVMVKVSSTSTVASPLTVTSMVLLVSPALKVNVPEAPV